MNYLIVYIRTSSENQILKVGQEAYSLVLFINTCSIYPATAQCLSCVNTQQYPALSLSKSFIKSLISYIVMKKWPPDLCL
jgi:hypothetical protein